MNEQRVLPRWRGFNLLEMFTNKSDGNWREDDFRWISGWGFDFIRLPMSYILWVDDNDALKINEAKVEKIDRAVELGKKYGIHICLNFHRAPGYSVNPERTEPYNLWKDQDALDAFCLHWQYFAERYKGISPATLSFDLVNEPGAISDSMAREDFLRVTLIGTEKIHEADPERLVIADGLYWGNEPAPELAGLNISQSCRAYFPMEISHFKANWIHGNENWPLPAWPSVRENGEAWNRNRIEEFYKPWVELAEKGAGVHCGEGGAFNHTPHGVALAWFNDVLDVLTSHNIGYSLWNFRGGFGILDSGRTDVDYEDWYGHKLDRKMLDLLMKY